MRGSVAIGHTGALVTPLYRTSTFRFKTTDDLLAGARGERPGFYTRYGHPNFDVVERKFAALHGAASAVLFGSGLAALAGILQGLLRPGDRVVAIEELYGGTRGLLRECVEHQGLFVRYVPTGDPAALEAAGRRSPSKMPARAASPTRRGRRMPRRGAPRTSARRRRSWGGRARV